MKATLWMLILFGIVHILIGRAEAGVRRGCVLGTSEILMANFSNKQIKDLKKGDKIIDGKLQVSLYSHCYIALKGFLLSTVS